MAEIAKVATNIRSLGTQHHRITECLQHPGEVYVATKPLLWNQTQLRKAKPLSQGHTAVAEPALRSRGPGSGAPVLTEHEVGTPGWLHQRADKTGEVDQVTDPSRPRAQSYVRQPAPVPGTQGRQTLTLASPLGYSLSFISPSSPPVVPRERDQRGEEGWSLRHRRGVLPNHIWTLHPTLSRPRRPRCINHVQEVGLGQ